MTNRKNACEIAVIDCGKRRVIGYIAKCAKRRGARADGTRRRTQARRQRRDPCVNRSTKKVTCLSDRVADTVKNPSRIGKRIADRRDDITPKPACQGVERIPRRAQPGRIAKIDRVVAGVGVPVGAVLGRVFADEAAGGRFVPAGAVVVELGIVVPRAAGEGDGGVIRTLATNRVSRTQAPKHTRPLACRACIDLAASHGKANGPLVYLGDSPFSSDEVTLARPP